MCGPPRAQVPTQLSPPPQWDGLRLLRRSVSNSSGGRGSFTGLSPLRSGGKRNSGGSFALSPSKRSSDGGSPADGGGGSSGGSTPVLITSAVVTGALEAASPAALTPLPGAEVTPATPCASDAPLVHAADGHFELADARDATWRERVLLCRRRVGWRRRCALAACSFSPPSTAPPPQPPLPRCRAAGGGRHARPPPRRTAHDHGRRRRSRAPRCHVRDARNHRRGDGACRGALCRWQWHCGGIYCGSGHSQTHPGGCGLGFCVAGALRGAAHAAAPLRCRRAGAGAPPGPRRLHPGEGVGGEGRGRRRLHPG